MFKYDLLPHLSKAGQLLTTSVRITGWFGRSYRRWKSSSESPDRLGTFSLSVHSAGNSRFAHCWFDQACERVRERVKEWGGLRSGIGRRAATHVVALVEEVGVHRLGPRGCCGPPGGLDLLPPPLEPVPEVPSGTTGEGRSFGSAPSRRERERKRCKATSEIRSTRSMRRAGHTHVSFQLGKNLVSPVRNSSKASARHSSS